MARLPNLAKRRGFERWDHYATQLALTERFGDHIMPTKNDRNGSWIPFIFVLHANNQRSLNVLRRVETLCHSLGPDQCFVPTPPRTILPKGCGPWNQR